MKLLYSWNDLNLLFTRKQLLRMAKAHGCKGFSRAKKDELIDVLLAMRICWPGYED